MENKIFTGFLIGIGVTLLAAYIITRKQEPNQMNKAELQKLLKIHVEQENYEAAAVIRDMINNYKNG